jgi:hypothetical protein
MAEPKPETPEQKSLKRLTQKVDNISSLSDILSNKKQIGGSLGKRLEKESSDPKKAAEQKKRTFKAFDEYLNRQELIANGAPNPDPKVKPRIQIQRKIIVDPRDVKKIL